MSVAALESVPTLPPSVIRKRGDELLELLRAARADESGVPLSAPKRPEPAQMALATRLLQIVRDVAAELELRAEVLATRKDVDAIAFGSGAPDASPLMRGWRKDVVGEKLLAALA